MMCSGSVKERIFCWDASRWRGRHTSDLCSFTLPCLRRIKQSGILWPLAAIPSMAVKHRFHYQAEDTTRACCSPKVPLCVPVRGKWKVVLACEANAYIETHSERGIMPHGLCKLKASDFRWNRLCGCPRENKRVMFMRVYLFLH